MKGVIFWLTASPSSSYSLQTFWSELISVETKFWKIKNELGPFHCLKIYHTTHYQKQKAQNTIIWYWSRAKLYFLKNLSYLIISELVISSLLFAFFLSLQNFVALPDLRFSGRNFLYKFWKTTLIVHKYSYDWLLVVKFGP